MDLVVRKLEKVATLTAEEKAALCATFSGIRHLETGQDLFHHGDQPAFVGAVAQGMLCRYKTLYGGSRQIIALVTPGDIFDLHGFTLKTMDHSAAALSPSIVATAPHAAVGALIAAYPRLAMLLWREAIVEAAILREWVVNCGRRSAYSRISHLFCEIYSRLESAGLVENNSCELPLSQVTLSDATGLSSVHMNRVLQQLRSEGLISLRSGRLTILDREGLANAAEFEPVYLHQEEPLDRSADRFQTDTRLDALGHR